MTGSTGLGSLPGTDAGAAVRLALSSTSEAWLPELPARGPWAAMIGRACGVLVDLDSELTAGEWKLAATAGIDARRARQTLRDDVEMLEENAQGFSGTLRLTVCGPWTLAASVFRPLGGRVLGDRGARRDVAQSLAAGVGELLSDLRRRLPEARVTLQVDEPSLPAVLAGRVPTEGGFFRHRSVEAPEVAEALSELSRLDADAIVHCCAPGAPLALLLGRGRDGAGFSGVSLPGALLGRDDWDALGAAVEEGTRLYLGVGDPLASENGPDPLTRRALGWLRPLELGTVLAERLTLTHDCGLAGVGVRDVPRRLDALARAADQVAEALAD